MVSEIHPFEPIFNESSRVLILGSFPSPASRANYYYGHPQNRFWKTLAELFNEPMPAPDRKSKRNFILSHKLALWDVLHSCEITGADDNTIRNPVPNKFQPMLAKSQICAIFTNGKKATELFQKLCAKEAGMDAVYLPSTSPANRAQQEAGIYGAVEKGSRLGMLAHLLPKPAEGNADP
ncbi:MAG: DNA-deoxyinosine glycosylase [Fibromonadaceae bacterium]|jgi:hypoxanthine-DNA glycosylase|nr:DNA-deoxyinosine glycosylase [Fibromonadaceae bacterium]